MNERKKEFLSWATILYVYYHKTAKMAHSTYVYTGAIVIKSSRSAQHKNLCSWFFQQSFVNIFSIFIEKNFAV